MLLLPVSFVEDTIKVDLFVRAEDTAAGLTTQTKIKRSLRT
jgi:hypothetical protein